MFRIECFCDDKKLARILWTLQTCGVYNLTSMPVINAQKRAGQVKAKVASGNRLEMLRHWLTKRHMAEVRPQDIREFAEQHGLSVKSYSNILAAAKEAGLLERIGVDFRYRVKLKPAKPKPTKPKRRSKTKLKLVTKPSPEAA
jgi:hypothetical protein